METRLAALWQTLDIVDVQGAGGLQVLGLNWNSSAELAYKTLDESLESGKLAITEASESGQVPNLKVVNSGESMVFLMAGEQLIGAKQNRMLNASVMVASHSELTISVSCVERGRWGYRSAKFGSSESPSHRRLRKLTSKQVLESYRSTGKPTSRQGEVWQEIDRKLAAMKSESSTDALAQTYEDHQKRLDEYRTALKVADDWHGVIFAFGGRIAGMDLFDKPATLAKLWPKLVQGYAIDAVEESGTEAAAVSLSAVRDWIQGVGRVQTERFASLGIGDDIRVENGDYIGAGLVVDQWPVHVEVYPNDEF